MQDPTHVQKLPDSTVNAHSAFGAAWFKYIQLRESVLFMVFVVSAWTAWNTYESYSNTIEYEYRLLEVRAQQQEARISGALRSVDLMLGSIVNDFDKFQAKPVVEKNVELDRYLRQLPEIRSLLVVDATGRIVAFNTIHAKFIGYDASNREYFKVHRDEPQRDGVHISIPFKTFGGNPATNVSRVVRDRNGHFAGVIAATLESTFFDDTLGAAAVDSGAQSLLIHAHGDIINMVPASNLIGKNLQGGIAYTEHLKSGKTTTRHLNKVKLEQVKKMSVFHDVPGAPLTVIASRDYDGVIGEWRKTMYSHLAGFLLLTAATLFFSWLAAYRQKSLVRVQQDVAARELELRTIIETEPECVKQLAADGTLLHMNRAGLDMIEAESLEQVLGQKVQTLVMPEYRDAFVALTQKVFSGESGILEFEVQGLKGGYRWLETHAVPLRNPQDQIVALLGVTRNITERKKAEIEREAALAQIKILEGTIPICMHCKKIRDDQNSWNQLEKYITEHSEAMFSHGLCPECAKEHYNFPKEKNMGQ
jgi:PAS domain S-box-containing protein